MNVSRENVRWILFFREFNHNLTQQLLLMLGKTGIWGMIVRKFVNQGMNDRLLRVVQTISALSIPTRKSSDTLKISAISVSTSSGGIRRSFS